MTNRHRHPHEDPDDLLPPAPDVAEDGIASIEEIPVGLILTGEAPEALVPPLDHPIGVEEWGVTHAEEHGTEPLGERLRDEEPDVIRPDVVPLRQLWQPGADDSPIDTEDAEVALVDDTWEDSLTAEELAMRIVDDPPGATEDDPGYLED